MKKFFSICIVIFAILFSSCSSENDEPSSNSQIVFKASLSQDQARSTGLGSIAKKDSTIITGTDILWFNETTGEIRLRNGIAGNKISDFSDLRLYLGDEYLFTTLTFASDYYSKVINEPVFYYNSIDNKFYIKDGYPEMSIIGDNADAKKERSENIKKIEK